MKECYEKLIEEIDEEIEKIAKSEVARVRAGGALIYENQKRLHVLLENCEHLKKYAHKPDHAGDASQIAKMPMTY